ncbi:hypothetical protein J5N97_028960 [Dioscorea zingiberensis]|uniref:KIB1-4 beta-propeller domain-containing protein n=1 Tax=Dioscorea zingiberensis TaxID=325984 RepID=A0A9D5BZY9_9LILI|nr:hypothetical protein J5N97_028960 [Dioscorea zingiberensis]
MDMMKEQALTSLPFDVEQEKGSDNEKGSDICESKKSREDEVVSGDAEEMNKSSKWAELPKDTMLNIAGRLAIAEYVRVGAVCTQWRSNTTPKPCILPIQSPWLMVTNQESTSNYSFFCMSTDRTYTLHIPELLTAQCCTTSHGFLVLLDNTNSSITLLNPLTRARFSLPSTTSFPISISTKTYDLEKIVLSSSPTLDEEPTIALALVSNQLAFSRLEDETWTLINNLKASFTDAIYFNDEFHVIDTHGVVTRLKFGTGTNVGVSINTMQMHKHSGLKYLVRSGDRLLMVNKIRHDCDPGTHAPCETINFEVCGQCEIRDKKYWVQVHGLSGFSLFLGANYSMSFRADEIAGMRRNCIYFTDDYRWTHKHGSGERGCRVCGINDAGIFRMRDEYFDELPGGVDLFDGFVWPTPKWFMPSLV